MNYIEISLKSELENEILIALLSAMPFESFVTQGLHFRRGFWRKPICWDSSTNKINEWGRSRTKSNREWKLECKMRIQF